MTAPGALAAVAWLGLRRPARHVWPAWPIWPCVCKGACIDLPVRTKHLCLRTRCLPTPADVLTRPCAGKFPGDDSPVVWGICTHAFHLQCINRWVAWLGSHASGAHTGVETSA